MPKEGDNDLDMIQIPEPNYFHDAQKNATKTLLLYTINSGHAFFPALNEGRLPHSSQCPAIMKEPPWDDGDKVPDDVKDLHKKILEQVITQDDIAERVKSFRERIKLDGFYPACCSCGIRYCFISEDDMVKKRKARRPCGARAT